MKIPSPTFAMLMAATLSSLPASATGDDALNPDSWPRSYQVGKSEFTIYQPQVLEWTEYRHLKATAALSVKLEGSDTVAYGTTSIDADTVADFEENSVRLGKRAFSEFRFPELDATASAQAETLIRSVTTPERPMELPLDSVAAAVERADAGTGDTDVNLAPPPIFYSESPAILVIFIGEPRLEAVKSGDPSLMFAANTNWDVLLDSASGSYYLLSGNQWLTTKDLAKGPWAAATAIPESFKGLPDDTNWSDVKSNLFVLAGASATPAVFVSYQPAEIILSAGTPQFAPISGTGLMFLANTESEIFLHTPSKSYYFLTAGRWFSAPSLNGPWTAATDDLPEDFGEIPPQGSKGNVLVSVRGTPEADEAVVKASIPQTATVDRASTSVTVSYDGAPVFKDIPGTSGVKFATNTSFDVFLVESRYFCCHQGIWFDASAATGPWKVCDKVPAPIYTIPPQSPKYNVTCVQVYDSTPETVQVGVTSGYSGAYVANGLVMFGLGYWLGHEMADNHYYPSPCWYGYGCGATYVAGAGYYRKGGHCYGPYGGAGYGAAYNPATGAFARGAYAYGPRGAVGAKAAYNPWTNTAAGRVGASTPYGSWGRSAVVRDDEWIRAGHRSDARGTVGAIQGSNGAGAVGVNRKYGSDAFIGKNGDGDVYAGKDGNIYRKNDEGDWQKREDGKWQNAPEVERPNTNGAKPGTQTKSPGSRADAPDNPRQGKPVARPDNSPASPRQPQRPSQPSVRPESPSGKPAQPATRPSRTPGSGQAKGYKNNQPTPSQLSRDSYSRQRSRPSASSSPARPAKREGRR